MRHLIRILIPLTIAAVIVWWSGTSVPVRHAGADRPEAPAARVSPDSVLVAYRAGTSAVGRRSLARDAGGNGRRPLARMLPNTDQVLLTNGQSVERVVARLKRDPRVVYAEPDYVVSSFNRSNDPLITNGSTWGMLGDMSDIANNYGSHAADAWRFDNFGTQQVYVGIIDEGVDYRHPDLAANVWTNPYDAVDGRDNDGNGFTDDEHGWDFAHADRSVYNSGEDSHGTHVAGTIGAVGGNGLGVAGVNWHVTMISTKFLGPDGGTISGAVKALDYLVDLKRRHGLNIVATNNSWGGSGYSRTLSDAINRAGDAGMLFIAAAGNDGMDNDVLPTYPANYDCSTRYDTKRSRGYDCLVAVAATTRTGGLASFSNYGYESVDLGAPGSEIMSTVPGNKYEAYSGTSMATPHVTGAVAACASANPNLVPSDMRARLMSSLNATRSLAFLTQTGGRLDAGRYTDACLGAVNRGSVPGTFAKLATTSSTAGDTTRRMVFTWGPSSGTLGYYMCVDSTSDRTCSGKWRSTGATRKMVLYLRRNRTYYWQARAENEAGYTLADSNRWVRFRVS